MKRNNQIPLALMAMLLPIKAVNADYFYDQGFDSADYRTDFDSQTEGTSTNPLTYDDPNAPIYPLEPPYLGYVNTCLFNNVSCGSGPTAQQQSYHYSSSPSVWNANANFWVLSVNNEPAFNNIRTILQAGGPTTANLGPPNQVHQLYSNTHANWTQTPASFATVEPSIVGETFPRAHLIVRHWGSSYSNDANGEFGIPFISIGAHEGRGHASEVGAIRSTTRPDTVKFKARIWDYLEPDGGGLWFFMFAVTEWGGKQRGLFIGLKGIGAGTDWSTSYKDGTNLQWNWPIQESFYHPGIDFAFIDTEDFGANVQNPYNKTWVCDIDSAKAPKISSTGIDYQFELDIEELFRCASARGLFETKMLGTNLPILGVHWGVEMYGAGGHIWTSVHDMKME